MSSMVVKFLPSLRSQLVNTIETRQLKNTYYCAQLKQAKHYQVCNLI